MPKKIIFVCLKSKLYLSIHKTDIDFFLQQAAILPVLDVRSPGEYAQAHIPGAYSFPIFSDEERKVIGTAYKQQSRQKAIKYGLDFFGLKMRVLVEEAEKIVKQHQRKKDTKASEPEPPVILVHCWRGGMRSEAVAWLLNLYGFEVYLLQGGYKAYRNFVLQQFEKEYSLKILGGFTGSGKTAMLQHLQEAKQKVIDLEKLANHKGSAFGGIGQPEQPRQEMFENLLANELLQLCDSTGTAIWMEDESQRIGSMYIPHSLWAGIRKSPLYFIDIPFTERLKYIIREYSSLNKEKLQEALERIQKRLGPMETKQAIAFLLHDDFENCFEILLKYYDKTYLKSLHNRENIESILNKIPCSAVDSVSNTEKLLSCLIQKK